MRLDTLCLALHPASGTMIDLQEIMEAWKNKKKAEIKKQQAHSGHSYSYRESVKTRVPPLERKDVFLARLKEGVKEPQVRSSWRYRQIEKIKASIGSKCRPNLPQTFHTITSGAGLYNQWQTRIHYYHFLKMKAECKKQQLTDKSLLCEMGGFTRLLHSGSPDNIMDEMPTVVVDLMPNSIINHDDYPVLNRPYAVRV